MRLWIALLAMVPWLLSRARAEQANPTALRFGTSAAAGEAGFAPLFNGRDLAGWTYAQKIGAGFSLRDGVVSCTDQDCGILYTEKEYTDFVLRFDVRIARDANSGIAVRAPIAEIPWRAGVEIQVIDDDGPKYRDIKPWQHHGSIYGVVPAQTGHLKPAGEWNQEEITVRGSHFTVKVNGAVIVDANLDEVKDAAVLEKHPGVRNRRGHLGLIGQYPSRVEYRNVRIKELRGAP